MPIFIRNFQDILVQKKTLCLGLQLALTAFASPGSYSFICQGTYCTYLDQETAKECF